jgi:hypothetical protein
MDAQLTNVGEVKKQIYALVEQLPPAQLLALHHTLQEWVMPTHKNGAMNAPVNGAPSNGIATTDEKLYDKQPWRNYTSQLKESSQWEEFLEAMAEARQENPQDEISA